ncbi:hypothetical protein SETIT_7G261900v2, partial [Setaria italica]
MMSSGIKRRTDYIDIHKMGTSMRKEIHSYWLHYDFACSAANPFSLHKVPQHILGVDRTAYEPIILSIGPYYHGKEPLQAMEKEKWNCSRNLQDYLKVIVRSERRARTCYSEDTKMEKKKNLQMLLLDGCFILVFLNGMGNEEGNRGTDEGCSTSQEIRSETINNTASLSLEKKEESNIERTTREDYQSNNNLELCEVRSSSDPKEKTMNQNSQELNDSAGMGGWYSCCLIHDLLLFENQIPFYIVEGIYEVFNRTETELNFLAERIAECMESILRHYPIAIQSSDRPKKFHHLLHLCHIYFRPSQKFEKKNQDQARLRSFCRILQFFEKNFPFHFGKKYASLGHKPDEIQQLSLQTHQLVCLESEHLPSRWRRAVQYHKAGVTLRKGRIIVHMMDSDEELSSLFARLVKQVVINAETNYYLKSMCQTLESHYQ